MVILVGLGAFCLKCSIIFVNSLRVIGGLSISSLVRFLVSKVVIGLKLSVTVCLIAWIWL